MYELWIRRQEFVWDDPLHRCYEGAYDDHHYEWGPWETLWSGDDMSKANCQLEFFRELNDYAVSQRGESAKCEFKIELTSITVINVNINGDINDDRF